MNYTFATTWRKPLPQDRLRELLRDLAQVAQQDAHHDMGTIFDAYNEQLQHEARPTVSIDEYLQVAHFVRVSVAGEPSGGTLAGDLVFLNRHLLSVRSPLRTNPEASRRALSALLLTAVAPFDQEAPAQTPGKDESGVAA